MSEQGTRSGTGGWFFLGVFWVFCFVCGAVCQSVTWLANQSISLSGNQLSQSVRQSAQAPVGQSVSQSASRSVCPRAHRSAWPVSQSGHSVRQSVGSRARLSVTQSVGPAGLAITIGHLVRVFAAKLLGCIQ